MMKNILIGLGVLAIGGLIYKAKKEQEFNDSINNITRRTGEQIVRDMERMNQETINNINNQQFMNSMM
jgi:hypothetical protein